MAEENQEAQQAAQEVQPPVFNIEKIYVKDISLEVPNAPQIFLQNEAPQVGIELQNKASKVDEGIFETVITITVTSKVQDKVAFLVEVAQAGIFRIHNVPEENISAILGITCPNILFPYAREAVSDIVIRAGFPPVLLNPINFEALYAQQIQQQQPAENATTH
jgi:preprotein translocase subunit SecB